MGQDGAGREAADLSAVARSAKATRFTSAAGRRRCSSRTRSRASSRVRAAFDVAADREVTLEANPKS
jgi:hypothetical protein